MLLLGSRALASYPGAVFSSGYGHSFPGPDANKIDFELGNHAQNVEQQLAHSLTDTRRPATEPSPQCFGPWNLQWTKLGNSLEDGGHIVGKFGLSATEIGSRIGASAMEVNRLLKDQGFFYGEPGAYGLTSKGEEFGVQRSHDNGQHGVYHVSYETTHFDPRITDVLDSSPEKLAKVRADISADRQAQRAARKIAEAEEDANFQASRADKEAAETQYEIDPNKVVILVVGILAAIGTAVVVTKSIEWYKRKKAEKAAHAETSSDTSSGEEK